MAANDLNELTHALAAPLGELIAAVGRGVAEAQWALDQQTLATFKAIYGGDLNGSYQEFRNLGYQPTWYRIPEASAEIYVSLSASGEERTLAEGRVSPEVEGGRIQLYATPVDATYSNTYDYQLQACSQLKFRIVPVPASGQAEGMKIVPDLKGKTYSAAVTLLHQLGIPFDVSDAYHEPADGDVIRASFPPEGSVLAGGQSLLLDLDAGQVEVLKVVPALNGKRLSDAELLLRQLQISYQLKDSLLKPKGDEIVAESQPSAGSLLRSGEALLLILAQS